MSGTTAGAYYWLRSQSFLHRTLKDSAIPASGAQQGLKENALIVGMGRSFSGSIDAESGEGAQI